MATMHLIRFGHRRRAFVFFRHFRFQKVNVSHTFLRINGLCSFHLISNSVFNMCNLVPVSRGLSINSLWFGFGFGLQFCITSDLPLLLFVKWNFSIRKKNPKYLASIVCIVFIFFFSLNYNKRKKKQIFGLISVYSVYSVCTHVRWKKEMKKTLKRWN